MRDKQAKTSESEYFGCKCLNQNSYHVGRLVKVNATAQKKSPVTGPTRLFRTLPQNHHEPRRAGTKLELSLPNNALFCAW